MNIAHAQEATTQAAQAQPTIFENLLPVVFIVFAVYFFLLRPQTKRAREHHKVLTSLKKGDEVLTSSGILGTIEGITEKFIDLKIAEGVRIKVLKTSVETTEVRK